MSQDDGYALPLLDKAVLERLRSDLDDDEGVWQVFIQDFIANLPHRIQKVRLTFTTGDAPGALDAILSLKTSSQMIGAERLAGLALEMERALRTASRGNGSATALPRLAAQHLRGIKQCADQTTNLLRALLQDRPGGF
ncbi:Hpt domain protein [Pseudarthrobacter chlorophenolicus A6]|uniref:Hpt domain protein n=1 Tax=Pseudarthrobacter chlorophenolicus (strain ATCC 700700 / DSM 12829 / CIP 107037 / JCM 12360 / KCTC 9906 / NCIMB 13794 / A6) TaxID=452863 RepID=B8HGI4_PSECP|nr:Hpt domain-containing protein [Pseudarthrobacter chlorophenolicus]ACL41250.1 Hpt domain protein [Pseudarthrobacter chlorophenolicus A6]SDQ67625.1 Hpt domain-containing protein [Pseudarthrobacter chlorophenolicus]